MAYCVNTNLPEFRLLQQQSGLSEGILKSFVATYQEQHHGEWPRLDELPQANSENHIKQRFKLSAHNAAPLDQVLITAKSKSIEEATIRLNDEYRDQELTLIPVDDQVVFEFKRRPSVFEYRQTDKVSTKFVDSTYIVNQLDRLAEKYGITINYLDSFEIANSGILENVPEANTVSAFVSNGEVYVNKDMADVDAPIHELMHVLLGSVRFTMPDVYQQLIESVQNFEDFDERMLRQGPKAYNDAMEEIFVEEYAKQLTGLSSAFKGLDPELNYQLDYEISRTLDSILMGDNSVRLIPEAQRYGYSLRQLGNIVNSQTMKSGYQDFIESGMIHRSLAQAKEALMRKGDLKEFCS